MRLPFAIGVVAWLGLLAGAPGEQTGQADPKAATRSGASDAEWKLEAAIHREIVVGDLKGAMQAYQAILASVGKPKAVAARALFQLGQCQEKLGQRAAAYSSYWRVVTEYGDQGDPPTWRARDWRIGKQCRLPAI